MFLKEIIIKAYHKLLMMMIDELLVDGNDVGDGEMMPTLIMMVM